MRDRPKSKATQRQARALLAGLFVTACWVALGTQARAQDAEVIATARYAAAAPDIADTSANSTPGGAPVINPLAPEIPAAPTPNPAAPTAAVPGAPAANNPTPPPAPPPTARAFTFTPSIGVEELFTDNALLTQHNRQSDFITRGILGLGVAVIGVRTQATATAQVSYDWYARHDALSGLSVQAFGTGSYALIPQTLVIEAAGTVTDGNVSSFGAPAIDRTGVAGRVLLATYNVGPHLTIPLGDFADLDAIAHFDQVFYSAADNSHVTALPTGSTIVQVGAQADTGKRFANLESITAAAYQSDNHGFYTVSGLESLFYALGPRLRLIGRAGYEEDVLPRLVNVNAPILSVGFEYALNDKSKISLEGGERYNRAAWVANAYIQVSDRIYVTADYQQVLEPDQVAIANAFVGFVQLSGTLPTALLTPNFTVNGNLLNQPSLDTTADGHFVYTLPDQTFDVFVSWRDRDFLNTTGHDRELIGQATYSRTLRPDLTGRFGVGYYRTYASPVFGASEVYNATLQFAYKVNSTVDLTGGYAFDHQEQLTAPRLTIYENIVFVALKKRF
ncbi:MAG TPA: TIGR03016 family PEP-CTERM system-associated outer membrane protein [Caulobacteraceae bacterium]|nr:TIGR03016 family PEP-CTERM system-associated outer membrane protein [Caulobacteraceae bacterium]